jgi:hypothetical protein
LSDHIRDLDRCELYKLVGGYAIFVTLPQDASCGQQRGLHNQNIVLRHLAEEKTLGKSFGWLEQPCEYVSLKYNRRVANEVTVVYLWGLWQVESPARSPDQGGERQSLRIKGSQFEELNGKIAETC